MSASLIATMRKAKLPIAYLFEEFQLKPDRRKLLAGVRSLDVKACRARWRVTKDSINARLAWLKRTEPGYGRARWKIEHPPMFR